MLALPLIAQVYLLCASIGALFFTLSTVMGAAHEGGGHGGAHGTGGHAGIGHGNGGHGTGSDSGFGHTTASHTAVNHSAGHSVGNHGTGHSTGHGDSSDLAVSNAATLVSGGAAGQRHGDRTSLLVMLLNPSTFAAFLTWFGATGLILFDRMTAMPVVLSVIVSIVGGIIGTRASLQMVGWLTSKMFASRNFHVQNLVGYEAEVTSTIADGRMGEIFYSDGGRRYTASARAARPEAEFKRGARVYIQDMRDQIAYVEMLLDEGDRFEAQLAAGNKAAPPDHEQATDPG